MSEFLTKAQETWLIYKLLIGKIFLTIMVTFCLAWQTAMAEGKWSKMDNDEKFYICCCILALVGDKLIAFFDKTASAIAKGKLPLDDNGGTQQWKKVESNEKTVTNS
jgi:hypothetical protein